MKSFFLTVSFVLSVLYAFASDTEHTCSGHHAFGMSNVPTHVRDSALLEYDVHFYGIDLEVNDTSTYIQGSTQILISVIEEMDEVVFELSISIGRDIYIPESESTIEDMISRADVLMYEEKRAKSSHNPVNSMHLLLSTYDGPNSVERP